MTYTGVFATNVELERMKAPHPYMIMGDEPDPDRPGQTRPHVTQSALEQCHAFALNHGLPEFDGYYGCDLETGEFVKP